MIEFENPLSYLRQVKGCPLSILVALSAASQPVAAKWLSSMTGYSPHSITSALVLLSEMQLVSCDTHRSSWRLTNGVRQLPLAPFQMNERSDREKRDPAVLTYLSTLNGKEDLAEGKQQALTSSDREIRDPELLDLLLDAGIRNPTASDLCELEHMNYLYAEAHIRRAQAEDTPTGLLIHRMKCDDPRPNQYLNRDSDRYREAQAKGWGLCLDCYSRPCDCDEEE